MSLKRGMLSAFHIASIIGVGIIGLTPMAALAEQVYASSSAPIPQSYAQSYTTDATKHAQVSGYTKKTQTPVTTNTTSTAKQTPVTVPAVALPPVVAPANAEIQASASTQVSPPIDFLRSVPLESSGYPALQCLPAKLSSADQVLGAIDSTPVLLVHMEALRRGYADLPQPEQEKLLKALRKRHVAKEQDLMLGFDLGYAELVYEHNKTGLFFLRKANDHFQDQFSNLAYGMAQAEADITLENAKPEEMTTRKMDVMYRLGDAVKLDAAKHQPGFWPSYVRVIEKLKPMAAYKSFSNRDFSLTYLPYGNSVVPLSNVTTSSSLSSTKPGSTDGSLGSALTNTCTPEAVAPDASGFFGKMLAQRSANFNGTQATIQFYPTTEANLYQVRVVGANNVTLASFQSNIISNMVEDVDGDGIFEIVARQYQYNRLKPVIVYHYTPCGFTLDKKIFDDFQ